MTKPNPRADHVRQIAEALFGSVISRDRHTMVIEVPADLLGAVCRSLGMGSFTWNIGKQSTHMATKRMTDAAGRFILCEGHQELMAYFEINVDLRSRDVRVEDGPSAAIAATRQTPPAR
jgi:hypothetical protein